MTTTKKEEIKNNELTVRNRLVLALNEMKTPKKSAHTKYKTKNGFEIEFSYAPLDEVMSEIKKVLAKYNLALSQGITRIVHEDSGSIVYDLETAVLGDGEKIILDSRPLIFTGTTQQIGAYETYMKRYALNTAFCLSGETDTDGNVGAEQEYSPLLFEIGELYKQAIDLGIEEKKLLKINNTFKTDIKMLNDEQLQEIKQKYLEIIQDKQNFGHTNEVKIV